MRMVPRYDEQFKESAIALLERPNKTLAGVARDLGVSEWTLRDWYTT
jgi:transposase-like protein